MDVNERKYLTAVRQDSSHIWHATVYGADFTYCGLNVSWWEDWKRIPEGADIVWHVECGNCRRILAPKLAELGEGE